jgi:hypothetical protein
MKRPVMLALTLAMLSRPTAAQSLGPSLALLAGSGADLATTLHALHTIPGAREGNPLLSHGGDAGFILTKAGTTLALIAAVHRLTTHRHPVLAGVIGYGCGVALAGVAWRNATLAQQGRQ